MADVSKVRRDEWRNQLRAGLPIKMSARLQMALLDALDAAENCIEDFKHDGVKWGELRRDRGDLRAKLAETEEALRLQKAVNIQLICAQDRSDESGMSELHEMYAINVMSVENMESYVVRVERERDKWKAVAEYLVNRHRTRESESNNESNNESNEEIKP